MIGADLNGSTVGKYIVEGPVKEFLDQQMDSGLVEGYSFVSAFIHDFMRDCRNDTPTYSQYISSASQYVSGGDFTDIWIQTVP